MEKKSRTKEEIRKEIAEVQTELSKLATKVTFTEEDNKKWAELFNKQLTLGKELYKDVKEQRYN